MNGGLFLILLIVGSCLAFWLRQRQIKGWKGPLFRRRGYNARAAAGGEASKGAWGLQQGGGDGAGGAGGFGGGGGTG